MGFQKASVDLKKREQKMKFNEETFVKYFEDGKPEAAMEYVASCIPDTLSKFYSFTDDTELNEKKLSCLADDCNWYENPINQNDPFDMKMGYIDEQYAKKSGFPDNLIEAERKILSNLVGKMLLCSFVDSDYSNLPMWAYYANNYQGYCVNYKINRKEVFFKVIYQKNKIRLNELFVTYMQFCLLEGKGYDIEKGLDTIAFLARLVFSLKHSSWRHEKEYRIICPLYEEIGQRISNIEMGLEVNDITIGLKCKPEYKERIMQIAKNRKIVLSAMYRREQILIASTDKFIIWVNLWCNPLISGNSKKILR